MFKSNLESKMDSRQWKTRCRFIAVLGINVPLVFVVAAFIVLLTTEDKVSKYLTIPSFFLALLIGFISFGLYQYARKHYIQALQEGNNPLGAVYLEKEGNSGVWRGRYIFYTIGAIFLFCFFGFVSAVIVVSVDEWISVVIYDIFGLFVVIYFLVQAVKARAKYKKLKRRREEVNQNKQAV